MIHALVLSVFVCSAAPHPTTAGIQSTTVSDSASATGGVFAPAALPAGTLAYYGLAGAPEIAVGYRQGFSSFELEARATFEYLRVQTFLELGAKVPLLRGSRFIVAPGFAVAFAANSGAKYYDATNAGTVGMRLRPNLTASYDVAPALAILGTVELPWTIGFTAAVQQFTPTLGAGVEFQVGKSWSVMGLGQLGVDVFREPLGMSVVRVAWGVRLGLGYRLF